MKLVPFDFCLMSDSFLSRAMLVMLEMLLVMLLVMLVMLAGDACPCFSSLFLVAAVRLGA